MQFFNYFLFIYFINLCNSFFLINKQMRSNFISRVYNHKLYMICDYYIDKDLDIYDYNNIIFSYINLEHEKKNYFFNSLLDEDGYDIELIKYMK